MSTAYPATTGAASISAPMPARRSAATRPGLHHPTGHGFAETFTVMPNGFIGGGQIGFNWQTGNLVFGLEADFQGSSQRDEGCLFSAEGRPASSPMSNNRCRGSARCAAASAMTAGPALFYLTGGLAYGKIETDIAELIPINILGQSFLQRNQDRLDARRRRRTALDAIWPVARQQLDDEERISLCRSRSTSHAYTQCRLPAHLHDRGDSHIFRTGINYHFNAGPVVAKF